VALVPDTRQEPRVAYSIDEVARLVGKSYKVVHAWVHSGELGSVRIGGAILIPVAELARVFPFDTASPPEPRAATG
jgi:excisionase family DNA binding protein